MQKLMPTVDTPDNAFHDGNPATGELGTPVYAVWLNAVQSAVRDIQAECHAILTANGFTPDPSRQNQLWAAIQKAIDSQVPVASTSQAGKVQLSSATNSSSEQTAATSKAVKSVKDYADTKAPLDSPALSGTPTAPTPPSSASGQEIATAAFVAAKVAKLVGSSPAALDTLKELADALGRDPNFATTMTNALAGKQPLNSTLTALSGKNVAQLLEYLGLRETINQAGNAVPSTRRINNHPLSNDITLTAGDVSAFALGPTGKMVADANSVPWNAPSGIYEASLGGASILILHFNMGRGSCPAVQFKVAYKNGGISYRSARDGYGFESGWVELMPNTKTVQDIRLSTSEHTALYNAPGYKDQPPYVITGLVNIDSHGDPDYAYRRALQKLINGTWYNVGGL